jgi:hypothetical protein
VKGVASALLKKVVLVDRPVAVGVSGPAKIVEPGSVTGWDSEVALVAGYYVSCSLRGYSIVHGMAGSQVWSFEARPKLDSASEPAVAV